MTLPDEDWKERDGYKETVHTFGEATLRLQVAPNEYGSLIVNTPTRRPVSTSGPIAELPKRAWDQLSTQDSLWARPWMIDLVEQLEQWHDHLEDTDGS